MKCQTAIKTHIKTTKNKLKMVMIQQLTYQRQAGIFTDARLPRETYNKVE